MLPFWMIYAFMRWSANEHMKLPDTETIYLFIRLVSRPPPQAGLGQVPAYQPQAYN